MKDVSIVIVNYRVKFFLEQTIRSAQEALRHLDGEIIVIDNNSGDDSIPFLKQRFPDVIYIENTENVGFARANNQGFEIANGKYTLILNPDTIIGERTILDCINWYESHPDCGGIGVMMSDGNGVFLPESKRSFPTPWVSFCKIFGLSALFPYSPYFAKYHLRYLSKEQPHKVDILAGAYIFVRTDILRKCQGFDNDFFMYGEDIDLSYRFTKAGYQNYYIPTPIIHYKGESTKKDSMKYVRVFYEAMLIFYRKNYPNYSKLYYFFIKFAVWIRAAIAMSKRVVKRILPAKKTTKKQFTLIQIVSHEPDCIRSKFSGTNAEVHTCDNISNLKTSINGKTAIIFDNRAVSYQNIIDKIVSSSNPNIRFFIYSSQSDLIISPKMKQI